MSWPGSRPAWCCSPGSSTPASTTIPTWSLRVEITFVAAGDSTRVTLTHRKLERFGDAADRVAAQLSGGWPTIIQRFADFIEEQGK